MAVVCMGCVDAFAPPVGAYRFDPPLAYRAAWQYVEECSGLRGNLFRVRWYAVPQDTFPCGEGRTCLGVWNAPHDIYVTEAARDDSAGQYLTVRHEMLHDLLGGGGSNGEAHPPVFVECGLMRTSD